MRNKMKRNRKMRVALLIAVLAMAVLAVLCFALRAQVLSRDGAGSGEQTEERTPTDTATWSDATATDSTGTDAETKYVDLVEEDENETWVVAASGDTGSSVDRTYATEEEKLAIIEGINSWRSEHGYAEMPVELNTYLTEQAQEWAEYLAESNSTEHSDYVTGNYVESIHAGAFGTSNLLGAELSVWQALGQVTCVSKAMYECPFIGVGVALTEVGTSIIVIQGYSNVGLYDASGYFVANYYWGDSDENMEIVETFVQHLYDDGHFTDYIGWAYYYNEYGDNDYMYIPEWLCGSNSWIPTGEEGE